MSDEKRLEVRPHGTGFAAWLDGKFFTETGDKYDTERAVRRWQEQIDAGIEPDSYLPDGVKGPDGRYLEDVVDGMLAKLAEHDAFIAARDPRKTGGQRVKKAKWEPFVWMTVALSDDNPHSLAPWLREQYEKLRGRNWPDLPKTDEALQRGIARILEEQAALRDERSSSER